MSDKYFVDTNILLYAHDRSTGVKHERARKLVEHLWTTGEGVVSTQVLQELAVNLRRKVMRPMSFQELRHLIEDFLAWEVVTNDPTSVVAALDIESRFKISYWDALIIHAAWRAGAAVLYSEELGNGQRYESLQVVNPLLT
jgi:predicted nucleic acid-binding protein